MIGLYDLAKHFFGAYAVPSKGDMYIEKTFNDYLGAVKPGMIYTDGSPELNKACADLN